MHYFCLNFSLLSFDCTLLVDERAVVIEKDTKGYGFNLSRLSDVHFVRVVEPTGAAYRAGARVRFSFYTWLLLSDSRLSFALFSSVQSRPVYLSLFVCALSSSALLRSFVLRRASSAECLRPAVLLGTAGPRACSTAGLLLSAFIHSSSVSLALSLLPFGRSSTSLFVLP